jgi:uncharacterized protein
MNPLQIINKYYPEENALRHILLVHSRSVADKALALAALHPELDIDTSFVEEAALLHDIGIFRTNAAGIQCFGTEPYICHGIIGADILRAEGYPRHALVCKRHTGTGLTLRQIEENSWPMPHRDMRPVSVEEQLICFADKFFSKTRLDEEKTPAQARRSLEKFGADGLVVFDRWCELFL